MNNLNNAEQRTIMDRTRRWRDVVVRQRQALRGDLRFTF